MMPKVRTSSFLRLKQKLAVNPKWALEKKWHPKPPAYDLNLEPLILTPNLNADPEPEFWGLYASLAWENCAFG